MPELRERSINGERLKGQAIAEVMSDETCLSG